MNEKVNRLAEEAKMIIDGYAFIKEENGILAINLNNPDKAALLDENADATETSMDDIELCIIKKYFEKNRRFMED